MTAISEIVRYSTNGVIDTQRPVWENIERLANAAHSWVTYDITTGLWSVVINRDEASAGSFSDNNIIGGITVSSSPTASVYNVVEIQHPDRDIEDGSSFVRAALPAGDLRPGEDENILSLTYPIINDQIQALNLGLTELKQSRLDLIIQFVTDYSMNYIRAGDIIDITNTAYGFAGKLFRVLTVEETDADDGGVVFSITAQEHSSDIYEHDLSRITLSNEDGVFSIGDIGAMSTPQITINGESQTPHMLIESVFPSISAPINGVEIWKYEITDPDELADWDDPLLYPDVNRKYTLSNVFFAEDTYELNSDIEFRLDTVDPGNYLLKLRPFNDTTKGPFTGYGSTITYVVDIAADLNGDSLVDNINNTVGQISAIAYNDSNTFGPFPTTATYPPGGETDLPSVLLAAAPFGVLVDGLYSVTVLFDQDSSGALGGRGALGYTGEAIDYVAAIARVKDSSGTQVGVGSSGGHGAFFWTDFTVSFPLTLLDAETYTLELDYVAYTGSNPGATITFTVNANVQLIG